MERKIDTSTEKPSRKLSKHLYMNLEEADWNQNVLLVGSKGSGKTGRWIKQNVVQMAGNYIVHDPTGEIKRSCEEVLVQNGYEVTAFILDNMKGNALSIIQKYADKMKDIFQRMQNNEKIAVFLLLSENRNQYAGAQGIKNLSFFYSYSEMLLSYICKELNYKERMPVHITMMLDKFEKLCFPESFVHCLERCTTKNMSFVISIEKLEQLKTLFPSCWELIIWHCDSIVWMDMEEKNHDDTQSIVLVRGCNPAVDDKMPYIP